MHRIRGDFNVNSYVKSKALTHDPERIAPYLADPLIRPYGYRGAHGQSIEMALGYYAFAKGAGFSKTVTGGNSGSCPNAAQYYGRLVNGVDPMLVIGAERISREQSDYRSR